MMIVKKGLREEVPKYGEMVKRAAVHRRRFNGAGGNYNGFGRAASNNNSLFIFGTPTRTFSQGFAQVPRPAPVHTEPNRCCRGCPCIAHERLALSSAALVNT
jgi:hypothetical protein